MMWKTLISYLILAGVQGQFAENEETDSPSSRRILGSSVVTSVSVVMETGNGKHTYYSDAIGHPLSKPHIASQVASPINLLNPDRYEFYTFNDDGELVKRLMTLEEIQGIIAGGDGEASNYNSEFGSQILSPENDVSGIVENVQNVLKEEIEAHKNPLSERPVMDTPDVSANWNLILPAFFGNEAVTPNEDDYVSVSQKYNGDTTTEHLFVASRMPPESESNDLSNEYNLPVEVTSISTPTEARISESSEKLSTINLNTTTNPTITSFATSELPAQINTMDDIFTFDTEKIRTVTQDDEMTTTTQKIANTPKIESEDVLIHLPIITERVNVKDTTTTTIEAQPFSTEINELPKITELVSMITRPTIKTTEKITTMGTSSVTFPPSTQFTHYEQITQSSSLKPVSNEEENYKTSEASSSSTPVNDNFVILSLNDNKNDYETTDANNTTILTHMPENVTSNVEQIIANASNDMIMADEKIATEDYNATQLIEEILNMSTLPSDFKSSIVTFASSIVAPNRTTTITNIDSDVTDTIPSMTSTTTSDIVTTNDDMQKISTSDNVFEATRNNVVLTTRQVSRPISTTVVPSTQKFSTFSQIDVTQKIEPTTKISTTTTTTTTTTTKAPVITTTTTTKKAPVITTTTIKAPIITTTTTTKAPVTTTTTTTKAPVTTTTTTKALVTTTTTTKAPVPTTTTTKAPVTTTTTTTKAPVTTTTTTKAPVTTTTTTTTTELPITTEKLNILTSTTQQASTSTTNKIPITSEQTLNPIIIENRFAVPSTTESNITTSTPEYTSQFASTPIKTTSAIKQTIESLKEKPIITSTYKPTTITITSTTTTKKSDNDMETTKPLIKIESSSSTLRPSSETTESTTNKIILTDSTTNKIMPTNGTTIPISSTSTTQQIPSSTIPSILNISEPYRKTEESNNKNTINNSWKLVETVKPPEIGNKPTPSVFNTIRPTFKPIDAYQSTKVDLSTQGNYGMPALSEDMYLFSKIYNELALKFWNALSINDINSERSAIVSPFGAISMLAMIFLGARGGTSGEMNDVLKLDDVISFNPHLVFKEVTDSVVARKSPSAIVRELYSDSGKGKVLDFYKERVRYFYDGHVEEVDFKKIHNVIRRRTNSLISKQTRGQMPQYLEETTLSLRAPMSTLSTNIFQADCSQASTEGRDGEFYFIVLPSIRQRRLVPIPAAVWRSGFIAGYDPELDATAVSLGTLSQAVSTIFVMPGQQGHSAPGDVLLRLEARLLNTTYIPETWNQLLKSMLPRPGLEIQLPRFLHKSVINTTEALKRMGLKEMFNKNKANLQGLNGIRHDFYLSDMMQVNEFSICGENQQMHTEVYPSVTEHLANHNDQMRNFKYVDYLEENEYDKYLSIPLPLRPRQARLPEVPKLRFDRPFLYFVRHNPTGLILHMGRFNPRLLT